MKKQLVELEKYLRSHSLVKEANSVCSILKNSSFRSETYQQGFNIQQGLFYNDKEKFAKGIGRYLDLQYSSIKQDAIEYISKNINIVSKNMYNNALKEIDFRIGRIVSGGYEDYPFRDPDSMSFLQKSKLSELIKMILSEDMPSSEVFFETLKDYLETVTKQRHDIVFVEVFFEDYYNHIRHMEEQLSLNAVDKTLGFLEFYDPGEIIDEYDNSEG
jgi:hypothetical protein